MGLKRCQDRIRSERKPHNKLLPQSFVVQGAFRSVWKRLSIGKGSERMEAECLDRSSECDMTKGSQISESIMCDGEVIHRGWCPISCGGTGGILTSVPVLESMDWCESGRKATTIPQKAYLNFNRCLDRRLDNLCFLECYRGSHNVFSHSFHAAHTARDGVSGWKARGRSKSGPPVEIPPIAANCSIGGEGSDSCPLIENLTSTSDPVFHPPTSALSPIHN